MQSLACTDPKRSILCMRSEFIPELHRWILKLTASHLQILNQEIILIIMVKKTVKKEFRKMKKKVKHVLISH